MKQNFNQAQLGAMRTAFLTAYPKIFTDIPYSTEIFATMKNLATKKGFSFETSHFSNDMAVEIEARHKAVNKALAKNITKNTLVVEIAAGLSPRHLEFKNYDYIELDFKPVMDIKRDIYKALGHKNLVSTLFDADLTDSATVIKILTKTLKAKNYTNIIVVNEGLFWYLTQETIAGMTQTFSQVLKDYNWSWITADCPTVDKCDDEYRNIISASAKVKRGKTFADYDDFSKFFKNLGLTNTRYKLADLVSYKDMTAAKFFSINQEDTLKRTNTYTNIAILKK